MSAGPGSRGPGSQGPGETGGPPLDVLVVGTGPAGWALASALARGGRSVRLVGPDPEAPWPNNYGLFVDELAAAGLPEPAALCAQVWPAARVVLDAARQHRLPRTYGQVDGAKLRAHFAAALPSGRAGALPGAVTAVRHTETDSEIFLRGGERLRATLVVDASGHRPVVAQPPARTWLGGAPGAVRLGGQGRLAGLGRRDHGPGYQSALGWQVRVAGHPFALDEMRLMDFSPAPGADDRRPTFLYVMPFGPHDLFVEETSLCERPARDLAALEALLRARLAALGVAVQAVTAVERCWIPMGVGVPRPGDRVLAFGGAAGLVHPATGYSLAHSLRAAAGVAAAVAGAWSAGPAAAAAAGHAALWPPEKRRAWAVLHFGMEVILRLDAPALRHFFDAFFQVPDYAGFLSGTAGPAALAGVMRGVFARVPAGVKARLVAGGAHPEGWPMLAALAGADVWR